VHTGRPLGNEHNFKTDQYRAVAVQGGLIAAAPHDGTGVVYRWDVLTGEALDHLWPPAGQGAITTELVMTAAPDATMVLVSADELGLILRRDAVTGEPIGRPLTFGTSGDPVRLALSSYRHTRIMVSAERETGRVACWDLLTGELIGPIGQATPYVVDVAVCLRAGRPIIVASSDQDVVDRWDAITGAPDSPAEPGTLLTGNNDILVISQRDGPCRVETSDASDCK
jgi:hypothetical protein